MAKRKPQRAGSYNNFMVLEKPTQGSASASGEVTDTWAAVATMWCSIWPIRGEEYWAREQVQADTTHIIRTWWRDDVDIDTTMRLKLGHARGDRYFYIGRFIDVNEAQKELEFQVKEKT